MGKTDISLYLLLVCFLVSFFWSAQIFKAPPKSCDGCSSASHATAPRKFCIYSFWISPHATFQTISTALTLKTTLTRQIFPGRCQLAWNLTTQSSASFTFCLELFCCIRSLIKITCALEVAFLIYSVVNSFGWEWFCWLQHRVDF